MIQIKRVYEDADPRDGVRFLVERLWPRGMRKEDLRLHSWLKDAAPSSELRRWFAHDPAKWDKFRTRYMAELDAHPEAWQPIVERALTERVTLLYSARDTEHNSAKVLQEYLERRVAPAVASRRSGRDR